VTHPDQARRTTFSKVARLELHIAQELGMRVTHLDGSSEAAAHSSAAQLEQA